MIKTWKDAKTNFLTAAKSFSFLIEEVREKVKVGCGQNMDEVLIIVNAKIKIKVDEDLILIYKAEETIPYKIEISWKENEHWGWALKDIVQFGIAMKNITMDDILNSWAITQI